MNAKAKTPFFFPGTPVGPYTLVREIGKGTFGVVWLAERRGRLGTTRVALKSPVGLRNNELQVLIRESELWIRASGHPNVMPVIEAEEYDGCVVIVTEYAQDGSLETWLVRHGNQAPSVEAAISMITGILTGLGHLHARGVIHRDLKPANILLQAGIPRITDFGLARLNHATAHSCSIAGTPEYMAPEAWHGSRSEQTDLWAIGIMLYETLTGRIPFPTDSWTVLRQAVDFKEPEMPPDWVPAHVRDAILRALQKHPRDRFRSAEDMAAALREPAMPAPRSAVDCLTQAAI